MDDRQAPSMRVVPSRRSDVSWCMGKNFLIALSEASRSLRLAKERIPGEGDPRSSWKALEFIFVAIFLPPFYFAVTTREPSIIVFSLLLSLPCAIWPFIGTGWAEKSLMDASKKQNS